jgi:hypothetical protein|nr:MAG TPA: hypothetical protein [Caudoviricetes sp.]
MIIDYDDGSTIGHGRGYPTGLEHEEKMDVIACLLDEGERNYVNEEQTARICSNQCAVGEMVTLDELSTMEHTIVRKAKEGELAFGYLLGKVQVKTSGLTLVTVAVLGDVFRLKLKRPMPADNCELPDVAIVNNVRFVWEDNKLYMEWEGCDDGEKVYFI